jgi:hypothetical protein
MLSMVGLKSPFSNNQSIKEYTLKCQNDYMKRVIQENKDKNNNTDKYNKNYLNLNNIDSFKEFDEYVELKKRIPLNRDTIMIPNTNENKLSLTPILFFLSISSIFYIYSTRK